MATLLTNLYAAQFGSLTGVGPMAMLEGYTPPETFTAQSLMDDFITEEAAKKVTNEDLLRMSYVPLALAELVWDYTQTIIDMASNMRIPGTKKLCIAIRQLKEKYYRFDKVFHEHVLDIRMKRDNAEVFDEQIEATMRKFVQNVIFDLKSQYPKLGEEWVYYLIAVQQCLVLHSSVVNYSTSQTGVVQEKVGLPLGPQLPIAFYRLYDIVKLFEGDKPMSESFGRTRKEFVNSFVYQMKNIRLTDKKIS